MGTTLAGFAMDDPDTWGAWIRNAEALRASCDAPVEFFAAIETDARGLAPFRPLTDRLAALVALPTADAGGEPWWLFDLDDARTEVTTQNRLRHLTTGQNLVTLRACDDVRVSHLLFLAADTMPDDDVLPRLLEMDHPYCAPTIPTYCLTQNTEPVWWDSILHEQRPAAGDQGRLGRDFPCFRAMPSAAAMLLRRDVFSRLRWRTDIERGMTDDPAYYADAQELLGIEALTRGDVFARHFPETIGPIETRGHDMKVYR